jgi:hypothetical protein
MLFKSGLNDPTAYLEGIKVVLATSVSFTRARPLVAALHVRATDQPTMPCMVTIGARRGFVGHHYKYAL